MKCGSLPKTYYKLSEGAKALLQTFGFENRGALRWVTRPRTHPTKLSLAK
jgi:hypothetical protein